MQLFVSGTPGGVEGMGAAGVQREVLARLRRRGDVDIVCTTIRFGYALRRRADGDGGCTTIRFGTPSA